MTETDKICGRVQKRRQRYGYWSGRYKLEPIPVPDWGSIPWYKRIIKRLKYVKEYRFTNTSLIFHHPSGRKYRPDDCFITDMGSVPKLLQGLAPFLFSKDLWLRCYVLHDSGYKFGGLYVADRETRDFRFVEMERSALDKLLEFTIKASGGSCVSSKPIWVGVWAGGWYSWRKEKKRRGEYEEV